MGMEFVEDSARSTEVGNIQFVLASRGAFSVPHPLGFRHTSSGWTRPVGTCPSVP